MTRHRGVKASLQGYRAPLSRCTLSRPPRDDEPGGVSLLPSPLPYACPKAVVTQKYVEQQVYEIFRLELGMHTGGAHLRCRCRWGTAVLSESCGTASPSRVTS